MSIMQWSGKSTRAGQAENIMSVYGEEITVQQTADSAEDTDITINIVDGAENDD